MRKFLVVVVLLVGLWGAELRAQSTSASVTGYITDPTKAVIVGAKVIVINVDTNLRYEATTNNVGSYDVPNLSPGRYRIEVEKPGFKTVVKSDLILHVQDTAAINFEMALGSASEIVTVEAGGLVINTTDATVSTVVDRQFVENMPLNGRSFQSLIQLTPGVVVTPTSDNESGQFSVNGQRASANYFMVDGVSANIGASANNFATQNAGGAIPGFSVLGGTNNLVSVDALQEFRVQTSTYAPEFGRTPGAQVSIETRSGTNQFHGALFEYLRNDVLDASDWFNGTTTPPLKKSEERQSDFGGVFGGPIIKNRTFFFFSYEGLRLRLPRTAISKVPSVAVRQDPATPAAVLPLLNAYPLPNGTPSAADATNQIAPFTASFSDPSSLDAASLRLDHRFTDHFSIFGRYNYSPSELVNRGDGTTIAVNGLIRFAVKTQTLTLGSVWIPAANTTNDLRFNYSRNRASAAASLDSFGGAIVPPESFFLPAPFSTKTSEGVFFILAAGALLNGALPTNLQRQINLVDGFAIQKGHHAFKFGADYRRLSPTVAQPIYSLETAFLNVSSAASLEPLFVFLTSNQPVNAHFHNLGAYAQDTWKMSTRLTMTYGLRWDVDFAPTTADGPAFLSLTNVNDPLTIGLAPSGTPLFQTKYANVAPRVGAAYLLKPSPNYQTVLRGGFGVFYDLATQQAANIFATSSQFPFGSSRFCPGADPACGSGLTFPLPPAVVQPPPSILSPTQTLAGFDPDLSLPYTLQWNAAVEQSLGAKQTLSASYVGASGRRLIQQGFFFAQGRLFEVIGNHATSDYHALQLQFRHQMSRGLQALASYTWSHSLDTASSSNTSTVNAFQGNLPPAANRGPSDFDVRHSFSAGVTYDIRGPRENQLLKSIAGGWSVDSMIQGRTATPVDVFSSGFAVVGGSLSEVRPNIVPGQPLYLRGSSFPGGKAFNPAAFAAPPAGTLGNLGRNALRAFGALQWDLAARREFAPREWLHLEFRAEFFNVLNHPNFANPSGNLLSGTFGVSTTMLNRGLGAGAVGGGGFSSLYQIGGPRSGQLALKLKF